MTPSIIGVTSLVALQARWLLRQALAQIIR
jgi:hypothetical protein